MWSPGLNTGFSSDPKVMYEARLAQAKARVDGGGRLFFMIAGFSVVNSLLSLMSAGFRFIIGLGITQFVAAIARESSRGTAVMVSLAVTALAAGFFFLMGVFTRQGQKWSLILGIVLYALDGALLLLWKDWLSIAFHGYFIYCLIQTLSAIGELQTVRQEAAAHGMPLS